MENNLSIKYIVYCTINIETKFIYIGVHKTLKPYEFDGYLGNGVYVNHPSSYNRAKTFFQRAVQKYGPSKFIRQTIAVFDTENEAFDLERQIVTENFLKRNDVYNTALGGVNGGYYTTCIKVYQYSKEGRFINEFPSILDAAKKINVNHRSLWRAIHSKSRCSNYFWTVYYYENLDLSKMKQYNGFIKKPVYQYSNNGEYECCYDSIKDASRVLNIKDSNISRSIKLGVICHNKYFTSVYAPSFSIAKSDQINHSKVYQYDLEGNFIAEYENMNQAKKSLNIKGNIYQAIKLQNICNGFQWRFEKYDSILKPINKSGRPRKIGKYDKDWNLIKIYPTLSSCKKENGCSVQHVLSGRNQFSKGFRYKYEE